MGRLRLLLAQKFGIGFFHPPPVQLRVKAVQGLPQCGHPTGSDRLDQVSSRQRIPVVIGQERKRRIVFLKDLLRRCPLLLGSFPAVSDLPPTPSWCAL